MKVYIKRPGRYPAFTNISEARILGLFDSPSDIQEDAFLDGRILHSKSAAEKKSPLNFRIVHQSTGDISKEYFGVAVIVGGAVGSPYVDYPSPVPMFVANYIPKGDE